MTEAIRPNGAHPITFSESNRAYWQSITNSVISGRAVELSTVSQTPKVTDTFSPLFDQGSFMDRATTFAGRFAKPALATGGAAAGIAGAALVVDLDGKYVSAQEPSAAPSAEPSLLPGESPVPTDPVTGLPCIPKPSAKPESSESPTPAIGLVENQGQVLAQTGTDVFVSAQAEPSAPPSVVPEASGLPGDTDGDGDVDENDGETAANQNCEPTDGTPWTVNTPVQEEKIDYTKDLEQAIEQFYVANPEVQEWVDDFGTTYSLKTAKKILKACKVGEPGDKNKFPGDKKRTDALIKSTRIARCGSLSAEFYDLGIKYNNPELLKLSRLVRDYALQSIPGNDVRDRLYESFQIYEDLGFFSIK